MDLGQAATAKLRSLYTEHVLPDGFLALWNNGVGRLCHLLLADQDPIEERPRLVALFVKWIITNLLKVDSSPTLSRFFTFRNCTDCMLTMSLIDMPRHAIQVRSVKPRQENQKRFKNVQALFKHPEAPQTFRTKSLTFQLTGGVEAMVSQVPNTVQPPPMVRLSRNEAAECVDT